MTAAITNLSSFTRNQREDFSHMIKLKRRVNHPDAKIRGTLWERVAEGKITAPNIDRAFAVTNAFADIRAQAWVRDDRGPVAGRVYTIADAPGFSPMHPRAAGIIRAGKRIR